MPFVDKLVLVDTHANPDPQRDNLAPDISVYVDDDVPDTDTKTDFSELACQYVQGPSQCRFLATLR